MKEKESFNNENSKQSEGQKNVILLGLVSFINDTSSKIILPILPLFIKEIGGGGMAVGLISGLGESIASLFKMIAGYWSDKFKKRKPFVVFGYFISSIGKFLFTFARTWPHVLLLRMTERFGKGVRSAPRDAILAASTTKDKRGKGFGIHRAMDSGGAVLGAIITFVLFWYFRLSFKSIFLIAGIIAFFSLFPLFFLKEEKKNSKEDNTSLRIKLESLSKTLRLFIFLATLFALGNFSYMFFVLRSQSYFQGRSAVGIPILLYILYNTAYTLFAVPAGILSDRIGRRTVLLMGYILFGLVCLGFIFSDSLLFFIILFVLFGLNYALVNATERAFISDLAKEEVRGTALGTFHTATSLATLPGGIIAGYLWDINSTLLFVYGAALSFVVAVLFFMVCNTCKET